jgi:L-serine/L-threonine ammonia-lyase
LVCLQYSDVAWHHKRAAIGVKIAAPFRLPGGDKAMSAQLQPNPLYLDTALIEDHASSRAIGRKVWLKMECFQPTGSFKLRGIGLLCQTSVLAGKRHLICPSGGNAGLAVAYCAEKFAIRATIVVPTTTPPPTRLALEAFGAQVVVHGGVWDESDALARAMSADDDAVYIPSFDHPLIWEGHGSLISEVAASGVKPDVVVVAVGGGGLFCGIVDGLRRVGWNDVKIVAVETLGADSLHQSIQAGQLVTLPAITSLAKSLGARRVTGEALKANQEFSVRSVVVTDEEALEAAVSFLRTQRVIVERACGAALSIVLQNHPALGDARSVLVVVCGGISVNDVMDEFLRTGGKAKI